MYEQEDHPLDDFDYELAKRADEGRTGETITLEALMEELGITNEDLQ